MLQCLLLKMLLSVARCARSVVIVNECVSRFVATTSAHSKLCMKTSHLAVFLNRSSG